MIWQSGWKIIKIDQFFFLGPSNSMVNMCKQTNTFSKWVAADSVQSLSVISITPSMFVIKVCSLFWWFCKKKTHFVAKPNDQIQEIALVVYDPIVMFIFELVNRQIGLQEIHTKVTQ